jgi:hypothetical protein
MSIALTFILRHHHPQNLQNFIMNSKSSHLDHLSFYIVFRILGRTASAVPFSPPRLQCLWAAGQQSGPECENEMETPPFKVRFSPRKLPLFGNLALWVYLEDSRNPPGYPSSSPASSALLSDASAIFSPICAKVLEMCWRILPPPFSLWMLGPGMAWLFSRRSSRGWDR